MKYKEILLGHGSGGKLSHSLISEIFLSHFDNEELTKMNDAAVLLNKRGKVVFSTDSYVVDPIFFKGGDIGKISVCGTVNDLAMMGAEPVYLSAAFIIEEGFSITQLKQILRSMKESADEANVKVVTGDTKVVPRGAVDKLFINTSGIGWASEKIILSGDNAQIGDKIIINGRIAEHGITVLAEREGLKLNTNLSTDSAPLNHLVKKILEKNTGIHVFRDPTRGGVATALNEIAIQSGVGIKIYEENVPISESVQAACEILGLDAFYIANEGKCLAFCQPQSAEAILQLMRKTKYGENANIIGEVVAEPKGKVILETLIGGQRLLDMLAGEQLPRIC